MASEEEANRLELFAEPVRRNPRFSGTKFDGRRSMVSAAEQVVLTLGDRLKRAIAGSNHAINIAEGGGAIDPELVEGTSRGECLEGALVHEARIDAPREIRDIAERPLGLALLANMLDRMAADIFERGERIADGMLARHEAYFGAVH